MTDRAGDRPGEAGPRHRRAGPGAPPGPGPGPGERAERPGPAPEPGPAFEAGGKGEAARGEAGRGEAGPGAAGNVEEGHDPVSEAARELHGAEESQARADNARRGEILAEAWERLERLRERGDVHIDKLTMFGDRVSVDGGFTIGSGPETGAGRGLIRLDETTLRTHLDHYVQPAEYGDALRRLTDLRLLVLACPAGTGRDAAAINLLTGAGAPRCYRLTDLGAVRAGDWAPPDPGAGYVVDLDVMAKGGGALAAGGVDESWIETTAARVTAAGGFLVVLTGPPRGALVEAAAHSPHVMVSLGGLDPVAVLIRRVLGPEPDAAALAALRADLDAAGAPQLLAEHPGPRTAVRLAAAYASEGDLAAAVEALRDPTGQVHAWFERHRTPETICFALAAAALEGAGYLTVSDAAVGLYRLLEPDAGYPLDLRFRERLRTDHAWIELVRDGDGTTPGRHSPPSVRFTGELLQQAVLTHAWTFLDGGRSALLRWLRDLTDHRDISVRARAAVSAGLIARDDFDHAMHRFLRSWAGDDKRRTREAAAAALGIVASEPALYEPVWELLESWSREGGSGFQNRLRLTAADTVGSPFGAIRPERSLDLLARVLGDPEWRGLAAVGLSVLRLAELGREDEVLCALLEWSRPQDDSAMVAQALSVSVFTVLAPVPWTHVPGGAPGRPLLIADGGRHRRHIEELWARALARKPAQTHALDALRDFLDEHADREPDALAAMRTVLTGVAARGDRHHRRLDWYLGRWEDDPDRPSRSAATLRRALTAGPADHAARPGGRTARPGDRAAAHDLNGRP
ncbi:hypothetical protein OHR68_14170 [Spirillospora sp. NBC_00431]